MVDQVIRGGYGISHTNSNAANGATPYPTFGLGNTSAWNYTQWTGTGAAPVTQAANPNQVVTIGRNIPVVILDPTISQIPTAGKICSGSVPPDSPASATTN